MAAEPFQPITADPFTEPWRIRVYPNLSGLGAQCMTEASDGAMWFGTITGAWSYDGFDWVRHEGEDSPGRVDSLAAGPGGRVYAALNTEIRQYKDGKWSYVFVLNHQLRGFEVRELVTGSDGEIWAATSHGALHGDGPEWTLYTSPQVIAELGQQTVPLTRVVAFPDDITHAPREQDLPTDRHDLVTVSVDPSGRVWLGTRGGEVLRFDRSSGEGDHAGRPGDPPGSWAIFNESDGVAVGSWPSILGLRDGSVWVVYGDRSDQISIYDGDRWRTVPLSEAGLPVGCDQPVQTQDGAVWVSGRYAISVYRDGRWTTYSKPDFPIPLARNLLRQASDGALWICGPNTEVVRIDYQTPAWLTLEDLNFQWEGPQGAVWFLHRDGRVVVDRGGVWSSYSAEDGLIDTPVALIGDRSGDIWAAGSHGHTAATARFDGRQWERFIHDELSWGIDYRGVLEASDGSLWFGAAVDSHGPAEHRYGLLQRTVGRWVHHYQPGPRPPPSGAAELLPDLHKWPIKYLLIGESRDGSIWTGRNILAARGRDGWARLPPSDPEVGTILSMLTTDQRDLWLGSQQFGALRFDGRAWRRFGGEDGFYANSARSLVQTADGGVLAATEWGFSRFDGDSWSSDVLPEQLTLPQEGGDLKSAPSGSVWINRRGREWNLRAWPQMAGLVDVDGEEFRTTRRRFAGAPPRTLITSGSDEVQHPGNLSVLWTGASAWRDRRSARLQYSHRMDGESWSPFRSEGGHTFVSLPAGRRRLEVRARDRDFNVDPTPAVLEFEVLPPAWRQGWFLGLMIGFVGVIGWQSYRVVRERGRLRRSNTVLEEEIKQRIQTQEEIRATNHRYAKQEAALIALTRSYARRQSSAEELVREVVEVAAQTLSVDVARVWVYGQDRQTLCCRARFELGAGAYSNGDTLSASECPRFFAEVAKGAMFGVEDAKHDDRARELADSPSCREVADALLVAPIHIAGSVAGVFYAKHVGAPRKWKADEETFTIAVANIISLLFSDEQRQHVEERLRQSQKMEAIGQLAGGVAHDFNNILAAMIMQIELTRLHRENAEKVLEGLRDMQTSAERAAWLTRQLLLFGSKPVMQPEDLDLNEAVRSMVRMLERLIGESIDLKLRLHPEPLPVNADVGMLDQLLMNLTVNARDAMPGGGWLLIETSEITVTDTLTDYQPEAAPGRYVRLSVQDSGDGIPPEVLPRILDPFFTTKEIGKGTGLGLATVFGVVRQHHGSLKIESEVGVGATFTVLLPRAEVESIASSAPAATNAAPQGGGETILLVEDEDDVRRLAKTMIEGTGYRVLSATGGDEAVELWDANRDEISLVLTDLVMPGQMGGLDVARRIRRDSPHVKVVYMSGYSPDVEGKEMRLDESHSFVSKPFTRDEILAKIRECLDG